MTLRSPTSITLLPTLNVASDAATIAMGYYRIISKLVRANLNIMRYFD